MTKVTPRAHVVSRMSEAVIITGWGTPWSASGYPPSVAREIHALLSGRRAQHCPVTPLEGSKAEEVVVIPLPLCEPWPFRAVMLGDCLCLAFWEGGGIQAVEGGKWPGALPLRERWLFARREVIVRGPTDAERAWAALQCSGEQ